MGITRFSLASYKNPINIRADFQDSGKDMTLRFQVEEGDGTSQAIIFLPNDSETRDKLAAILDKMVKWGS